MFVKTSDIVSKDDWLTAKEITPANPQRVLALSFVFCSKKRHGGWQEFGQLSWILSLCEDEGMGHNLMKKDRNKHNKKAKSLTTVELTNEYTCSTWQKYRTILIEAVIHIFSLKYQIQS